MVEIIIVGSILAASITLAVVLSFFRVSSSIAIIKHHNETIMKVDLSKENEERHFQVKGDFSFVTIAVKKDYICIEHNDCPSQYCVNEGWVKSGEKPIICAYNGISIYFSEDSGGSAILG
ncbi:MAG: NusG domain II-containing protein [Bacilli bacterium]|nr:NusG domain II-containing protein [Bacilli bacterium]